MSLIQFIHSFTQCYLILPSSSFRILLIGLWVRTQMPLKYSQMRHERGNTDCVSKTCFEIHSVLLKSRSLPEKWHEVVWILLRDDCLMIRVSCVLFLSVIQSVFSINFFEMRGLVMKASLKGMLLVLGQGWWTRLQRQACKDKPVFFGKTTCWVSGKALVKLCFRWHRALISDDFVWHRFLQRSLSTMRMVLPLPLYFLVV